MNTESSHSSIQPFADHVTTGYEIVIDVDKLTHKDATAMERKGLKNIQIVLSQGIVNLSTNTHVNLQSVTYNFLIYLLEKIKRHGSV